MPTSLLLKKATSRGGFTLIETMLCVGILIILGSLSIHSFSSLLIGKKLNQTMETITRGTAMARQIAVNGGAPVAFVISSNPGASTQQALLFLKGASTSDGGIQWKAVAPWQILPQEVRTTIFQRNGTPSFYHSTDATNKPLTGDLPLQWNGSTVSDYFYIIFRPDGSVDSPENGPSLSLVRANQAVTAVDYIVLVQEHSGRSKVIEP